MIGQTLIGGGLPRVKVVGSDGGAWIVTPLDAFGSPYVLTDAEMAAYAAAPPTAADEARAWSKLGAAHR